MFTKALGRNRVNIGSPERPIRVPQRALRSETEKGRAWWEKVATGSVVLEPEVLDKLLERTDGQKG